jgi:hypothetical protein
MKVSEVRDSRLGWYGVSHLSASHTQKFIRVLSFVEEYAGWRGMDSSQIHLE